MIEALATIIVMCASAGFFMLWQKNPFAGLFMLFFMMFLMLLTMGLK